MTFVTFVYTITLIKAIDEDQKFKLRVKLKTKCDRDGPQKINNSNRNRCRQTFPVVPEV